MLARKLGLAASIWVGLAIIAAVTFDARPSTWTGAAALLLLGPPVYLLVSYIGEGLASRIFGASWLQRVPSWLRIVYGVLVFAAGAVALVAFAQWLNARS